MCISVLPWVSGYLELELQIVVSCHVGTVLGTELGSSGRAVSALSFFLKDILFIFMYECSICIYACITEEGSRSHYRWLGVTMWLLGTELRTPERTAILLTAEPSFQPLSCLLDDLRTRALEHRVCTSKFTA